MPNLFHITLLILVLPIVIAGRLGLTLWGILSHLSGRLGVEEDPEESDAFCLSLLEDKSHAEAWS